MLPLHSTYSLLFFFFFFNFFYSFQRCCAMPGTSPCTAPGVSLMWPSYRARSLGGNKTCLPGEAVQTWQAFLTFPYLDCFFFFCHSQLCCSFAESWIIKEQGVMSNAVFPIFFFTMAWRCQWCVVFPSWLSLKSRQSYLPMVTTIIDLDGLSDDHWSFRHIFFSVPPVYIRLWPTAPGRMW